MIAAGASRDRLGARRHGTGAREVRDRLHATLVGADVQSDAVAELPGVGDLVGAVDRDIGVAVVLWCMQRTESADAALVIGERHRMAEGEAAPLDERTGDVGQFYRVLILQVELGECPQRAVGRLRPRVDREAAAMPGRVVAGRAVLCAARSRVVRSTGTGDVVAVVGPDIARELDTRVGAGDVVPTVSVQRTDLHVLDRLGLDGKIGSLRPGNRDQTRRRTEEKTFHHLHLNLQVVVRGRDPSPPGCKTTSEGHFRFRSLIDFEPPASFGCRRGDLNFPRVAPPQYRSDGRGL